MVLINISVHNFNVLLNLVSKNEIIGITFGLAEDDGLGTHAVANQYVSKCTESVLIRTINCEMVHFFGCLVLQILCEINNFVALGHVSSGNLFDP